MALPASVRPASVRRSVTSPWVYSRAALVHQGLDLVTHLDRVRVGVDAHHRLDLSTLLAVRREDLADPRVDENRVDAALLGQHRY